jgi:hypothetical protein
MWFYHRLRRVRRRRAGPCIPVNTGPRILTDGLSYSVAAPRSRPGRAAGTGRQRGLAREREVRAHPAEAHPPDAPHPEQVLRVVESVGALAELHDRRRPRRADARDAHQLLGGGRVDVHHALRLGRASAAGRGAARAAAVVAVGAGEERAAGRPRPRWSRASPRAASPIAACGRSLRTPVRRAWAAARGRAPGASRRAGSASRRSVVEPSRLTHAEPTRVQIERAPSRSVIM